MNLAVMQPQAILDFWFTELTPKDHFAKDAALDALMATQIPPLMATSNSPT